MSVLTARVSYYPNQGVGNEVILTDWTNLTIKRGLDDKSNTVEVRLKNKLKSKLADGTVIHRYVNNSKQLSLDGSTALQQDDIIKVWLRWSDSASDTITYNDSSAHLITIAEIEEWQCNSDSGKSTITLKCVDKTFEVLNKLWVSAYTYSLGLTCPTMAITVIQSATDGIGNVYGYDASGNFVKPGLYGVDARAMAGTYTQQAALDVAATGTPPAYVESKRIDNTNYPIIQMTKVWKPVYEWLKEINDVRNTNSAAELAADTYVQDRNNRFYVDQKNRYHQFYPADTIDYDITAGTVDADGSVISMSMEKKTFDIINMVIFSAGKDLDNVGILWYYFDRASKMRKLKMKYIPMLEIGSEGNGSLRAQEVAIGNISVASDGVVTILVASGTTSWGESYSSEADYKEKFRTRAKSEGETRAKALVHNRGNPRWKGSYTVKKGYNYAPGQLSRFTAMTHGINQQLLRIGDVTHQITPTGWVSTLDVEEDEPKYGETV